MMHTIRSVMRYSAEHKQETRNRIVRAAARQFCRPEGKGSAIADLMRELGLTHGGFYKHFDSKQQLLAEAITKGFEEMEAGNAVRKAKPASPVNTGSSHFVRSGKMPTNGLKIRCPLTKSAALPNGKHRSIKGPISVPVSLLNAIKCYPCREVTVNYNRSLLFHGSDTRSTAVQV